MDEERKITNKPPSGPILKNEFRKEVRDPYAGIPEDELTTRDQFVLLKELRYRIDVCNADHKHISEVIDKAKALRMELLNLAKSPGREGCIKDLEVGIDNFRKQLKTLKPPRQMLITRLALEELFAETEEAEEDAPDELSDKEVDRDLN